MLDLDTRLREYVEAAAPPVTAEEILGSARGGAAAGPAADRRAWWRSPPAVAALAAVGTLVVIGGVTLGVRALTGGDAVAGDGSGIIDPVPGVAVPIGDNPSSVAVIGQTVFVTVDEGSVVRFDPESGSVTGRFDGLDWGRLVVLDGELWLVGDGLRRVDPDRMEIVAAFPDRGLSMVSGHGSIWSRYPDHSEDDPRRRDDAGSIVLRLDPVTFETTAEITLAPACPGGGNPGVGTLAATSDAVWATTGCDGAGDLVTFQRIDPATDEVTRVVALQVGEQSQVGVLEVLVVDDRVWATAVILEESEDGGQLDEGRVYRIGDDDEPELVATVGRWPAGAVHAGGAVWVTDCLDATLTRIDTATGAVQGRRVVIGVPAPAGDVDLFGGGFSCPGPVAVQNDTLWITAYNDGTLIPVYLAPAAASGSATTSYPPTTIFGGSTTTEAQRTETTAGPDDVPPGG